MDERVVALKAYLAEQEKEGMAKIAIEDSLALPDFSKFSMCAHYHRDKTETHWSVSVSKKPVGPMTSRDMLSIYEQHQPRMLSVPLFKRDGFQPSWGPEPVNYSARHRDSKEVGSATIELRQHGNDKYRTHVISYWLSVDDVGFVEVHLEINHLPPNWSVATAYRSFSTTDGSPAGFDINPPRAGLPGTLRTNMGGRGSWDYTAFWDSAETFRSDLLRAGVSG